MPRPKKSPRERFQITLPKPQAKALRAFAKKNDKEISEVVSLAISEYLTVITEIPARYPEPIARNVIGS